MIIYLEGISGECFLFNVNVNVNLKFFWAPRALSEGTQELGFSEGTLVVEHSDSTQQALWQFRHSDT